MIIQQHSTLSVQILATNSTDVILLKAKTELEEYFSRIFGSAASNEGVNVVFKVAATDELRHDGFAIHITDTEICIASCLSRGILFGVYELLKKLGCYFLFPKKSTNVVPTHTSYTLENGKTVKNPLIEYRGMCLYNTTKKTLAETLDCIDFMAKNCYNYLLTSIAREDDTQGENHAIMFSEIRQEVLPALVERGIVIDMSEHSTDTFFPREKLFKEHPEWFSLQKDKRAPGQICYSNREAVDEYIKAFVAFVKNNDYFDSIGTWPLDGSGYCECEKCQDPLLIYSVVCEIAQAIAKVRPELTVEHLAYTPQSFARPKQPLPKNMSVLVCSVKDNIAYDWSRLAQDSQGAFYFDYETADNYRYRANMPINPFHARTMVNNFTTYKYKGIVSLFLPITAWWQAGINFSVLSQCYFNPLISLQEQFIEIAKGMFGQVNAQLLGQALYKTADQLHSKLLWGGHPHKHTYMSQHNDNRCEILDEMHLAAFNAAYDEISAMLAQANTAVMTPEQKLQLDYFKAYLELQKIYFTDIDMFNSRTQNEKQVERYLDKLQQLESAFGEVFVSSGYARWRIVGRDNILKNSAEHNAYQPKA